MDKDIEKLLEECLKKVGKQNLTRELKNLILMGNQDDENVLTIISNAGTHPRAPAHNRGEIYVASEGQIDFGSESTMQDEFHEILVGVARKLKSKSWRKVYLVPFGPAVLAMQIKLLVYRILYMETIDVFHVKNDIYYDVEIDLRNIAIQAEI